MGKKLYVGNLPFSFTDDALAELFGQAGTVESAKVVIDRESGRSKGFGFVEYSSDSEAAAAIDSMNGRDVDGRSIKVSEARPPERREGGMGGGGGGGGG